MPKFGKNSLEILSAAHFKLQQVMLEAIKHYDFSVVEAYRDKERQNELKAQGKSNAKWGQSPHNWKPSFALDVIPYPSAWQSTTAQFLEMQAFIMTASRKVNVDIVWGGSFVVNGKHFADLAHYELKDWEDSIGEY